MRIAILLRTTVAALLFLAIFSLPAPAQDAANKDADDELRKLLQEGIKAYESNDFNGAYEKFETAFQKVVGSPYQSQYSDVIKSFLMRSSEGLVARMMNSSDERLRNTALRLYKLAGAPGRMVIKDGEEIKKYIELLKSEVIEESMKAEGLLRNSCPYSLKYLIPYLAKESEDRVKGRVMRLLILMGRDAVHPIVAGLKSKNILMRENCALLLGDIRDERAIPYLKRIHEDPNERPEMRAFVNEALQKITGKEVSRLKSAKDEFFQLAEKYYYGVPSVMIKFYPEYFVFDWDGEKDELTEREVYPFLYEEEMAEDACYEALKLNADDSPSWALLCCVYFSLVVDLEKSIETAEALNKQELLPEGTKMIDAMKERMKDVKKAIINAGIAGKQHIYQSLIKAADDGRPEIAVLAIEAIKAMGRAEELPMKRVPQGMITDGRISFGYPLINALTHESKIIRYASSEAMIKLNPMEPRLGMELVIPNLIDAIGESSIKVALIVHDMRDEKDRMFVQRLIRILSIYNIYCRVATNGADGLDMSKRYPSQDIVFLQSKIHNQVWLRETLMKESKIETVLDTFKKDIRTRHIPIVLLCDDEQDETIQKKIFQDTDKVNQFFVKPPHESLPINQLLVKSVVDKALETAPTRGDSAERANRIAQSAAETFASIDPTNTRFPYLDAVDALIKVLSPELRRPDTVRLPAIRALGRYGDKRALDCLAKILADKGNDKSLRAESALAMAQIFKVIEIPPPKEIFNTLKENMFDEEYDVEYAVGTALGNAKLLNKERLEIELLKKDKRKTPSQ